MGSIGDPVRAGQTYNRCLDLASGRDPAIEYNMLLRLSEVAMVLGDLTEAKDHIERAKTMVDQGRVTYRVEQGATEAEILLRKGDCAGALEHFERMRAFWQRHPARRQDHVSYACSCKARAYLCAHRYADAIRSASEGLAIATAGGMPKESIDNLGPLAMAYEGLGDPWNAMRTWKRFYTMRDSANAALADSRLTGAMLAADFEQQQLADSLANAEQRRRMVLENEAVVAREKNRRNVFLFSGIGALVLAGSLWSRLRYTRRSRAAIQKEKDISEGLLLNILPEEVAHELKAKGHADAKHFDNVTILFTDFKGFTEASEKLSPQELVEELNTCFKAFDGIITAHGIEKIKTIGDAYMCAGGLPVPASSKPVGVVQAALEMQAFMVARKKERDALGKPAFDMRVGIHTGPVVAGIVGVKKFAYDIWGDTVNIASRMESSGEVGQVNISEATYALVKDEPGLTFTPRGKVQAKGKGEMEMYFVGYA
ncbi:MAG: hypothetical protein IPG92_09290 [Flavobacteriales bacterium]|nr:hypothetical protein [Flavobacteriales bacterium]